MPKRSVDNPSMPDLNRCLLIGNLTRDPSQRTTRGGITVCDFGLAINRTSRTPDGQTREEVCFIDIVVWRRQAELCMEFLKKGRSVMIEGRLELNRWETPDGQKRSKLRVVADRVQFMGPRDGGRGRSGAEGAPARAAAEAPLPDEGMPPGDEPPPEFEPGPEESAGD